MAGDETIGDMTPEQPKQEKGQVAKDDQPRRGTVIFSRPKNDTFEAYKAWILSMTRALAGQDNDDMTEDQWRADWRQFWAGRRSSFGVGHANVRINDRAHTVPGCAAWKGSCAEAR